LDEIEKYIKEQKNANKFDLSFEDFDKDEQNEQ